MWSGISFDVLIALDVELEAEWLRVSDCVCCGLWVSVYWGNAGNTHMKRWKKQTQNMKMGEVKCWVTFFVFFCFLQYDYCPETSWFRTLRLWAIPSTVVRLKKVNFYFFLIIPGRNTMILLFFLHHCAF